MPRSRISWPPLSRSPEQITFFKSSYKRATVFAQELVQVDFQNSAQLGSRVTATIPRNGDLLSDVYLVVQLPTLANTAVNANAVDSGNYNSWVNKVGYAMIQDVSLEIGGQVYDKHTGEYFDIMDELTLKTSKKLKRTIGDFESEGLDASGLYTARAAFNAAPTLLYIPLRFWFNQTVSMALPLVALSFHDTKITFNFRSATKLIQYFGTDTSNQATAAVSTSTLPTAYLLCNYVYLDAPERVTFGSGSEIEYLIDQVQYDTTDVSAAATKASFNITFNHPVKELIFVVRSKNRDTTNDIFNYAPDAGTDSFNTAVLRFNGHDRFAAQPPVFWTKLIPSRMHTNIPTKNIHVFSFALDPESEKPTGTANFSRIDQIVLNLDMASTSWPQGATIHLFARSYNVIKIVNGMAGIKYAN